MELSTELRSKNRVNVRCAVSSKSGEGLVSAVVTTINNETGDMKNL